MKCFFSSVCDGTGEVYCTTYRMENGCCGCYGDPEQCYGCPRCNDEEGDFQEEYEDEEF